MNEEKIEKKYFDNGQISDESRFNSSGNLHGLQKEWHKNGQPRCEISYDDGLKHGTWIEWRQNGDLIFEKNFQHGSKHGLFRICDAKGQETVELYLEDQYIKITSEKAQLFITYLQYIGYKIEPPPPPIEKKQRKKKHPNPI